MPKLKDCKIEIRGAMFESTLRVDRNGVFSIKRPGAAEDWPHCHMDITGALAEEVESEWKQAVRDYAERSRTERKVLIVKFDSMLRDGGKKDFFVNEDAMLYLKVAVALETTTKQGARVDIAYQEHPDVCGLHKENPFPWWMQLSRHQYERGENCVVEWSPELEAALVRACAGIQAIVDMLDDVFSSPERLKLAASRLQLLPAPDSQNSVLSKPESHNPKPEKP